MKGIALHLHDHIVVVVPVGSTYEVLMFDLIAAAQGDH